MFSVVIPLYNKEKYIRATVESVLAQDHKDFEIIIVNDGSTDASLNEIQDISDPRIVIIDKENAGVGAARNTGMSHARFEWIAFIDADDIWASNHLSELKLIIDKFPSSGLVSTSKKSFYGDPDIIDPDLDLSSRSRIRSINYFLEPIVQTSAAAIKKSAVKKIGGFSSHKNGEDIEYWVRLALSYPVAFSDLVTCYYRRDTGGITDSAKINLDKNYFKEHKSLNDISPSLGFIANKSQEDPSILKDPNVIAYVNNSLLNGAKMWLFRDNIPMSKQMTKFAIPEFSKAFGIIFLVKKLPVPIIDKAVFGYKKIKKTRQYKS